jgi:phosphoadenylyl-sulfate reductase (thioredoxin)
MSLTTELIDADTLNAAFEAKAPEQIVAWAVAAFGDQMIMSSSFGADSPVLIHLAVEARPDIKIIFCDTGYLFPETHRFMEQMRQRFNLNVWTYRTLNDPIAYLHKAGEENPTWRNNIEACCAANKNEPFERAMRELAPRAWLRGIRRQQTDSRKTARFVEWDKRHNTWAISPLLNWTSRQTQEYVKQHDLPSHPLVDQGYLSIGCNPLSCTRPVQLGEDPRAGRWAGRDKLECGINLGSLDSANQI